MPAVTALDTLFGGEGANAVHAPADQAVRVDQYKDALLKSAASHDRGDVIFNAGAKDIGDRIITKSAKVGQDLIATRVAEAMGDINKAAGADGIGSDVQAALAKLQADLVKDWTPTNPVSSGLVPYDLEAPAKLLVPLHTPLRNSIPRGPGKGNARQYKRITSFSNANVPGGAARLSPFFNSLTGTSQWGPTNNITLARPQKITYTGDSNTIPYVEMGLSDSVDWVAQFESIGFDDLRGLSHTALLYAHMMGEEMGDLFGRGSLSGYSGSISAPTVSVAGSDSGGSLASNTYFVYVAAVGGFGQSAVSAVQNSGARTGPSASATITVTAEPTGALYYNLYVGTVTGIGNAHFQASFAGNTFVLQTYNAAGATTPGTDTSADANSYDGYLTVQSNPAISGYVARVNAALSTTNPGSEFDTALQTMYVNNGADPDEFWMTGAVRTELNQILRKGGASGYSAGYRTNIQSGSGDVTMGSVVTGFLNANTGKVVDVKTHRFMPTGAVLIRSTSLPLPTPHVPAPSAIVTVQDYMAVDWPTIQMTYDTSTYAIQTLIHYAPAWSGVLLGVL